MKFQQMPFELVFSLMQKNLGDSLVFTEVYSQVNAINTFSNANDLTHFFKKNITKIVALKNLTVLKTEMQIASTIFDYNFTNITMPF